MEVTWPIFVDCNDPVYPEIEESDNSHFWQTSTWEDKIIINQNSEILPSNLYEFMKNETGEKSMTCQKKTRKELWEFIIPEPVGQNDFFYNMDSHYFKSFEFNTRKFIKGIKKKKYFSIEQCEETFNQVDNLDLSMTATTDEIILYESAEQNPPFPMLSTLTSRIVTYYNENTDLTEANFVGMLQPIGKHRLFLGYVRNQSKIHKESTVFKEAPPIQIAVENQFFRTPVYQQKNRDHNFLLISTNMGFKIREFEAIILGGKQMPMVHIPHPNSSFLFKNILKIIFQKIKQKGKISNIKLTLILSTFHFLPLDRII